MNEPMNILIAEADAKIVSQLEDYLVPLGHKVYPSVTTGEDLMEQVKLLNPSLIITDFNLDGQLDGVEAIARLEGIYNIPYIFITAFDDLSSLISSYYLNPAAVIKKPVDHAGLHECMDKVQLNLELV